DEEIFDLVAQFEKCTWPYKRWTHRAHLAVAAAYLRKYSLAEATERMRRGIQLYNRTCGDPDGYHETITIPFMHLIFHRLHALSDKQSLARFVDKLFAQFPLCSLLAYYSAECLWSPTAKAGWVPPDLMPFD